MFCPKCGMQNETGVNFCASCGAKMVDNQPTSQKLALKSAKTGVSQGANQFIKNITQVLSKIKSLPKVIKQVSIAAVFLLVALIAIGVAGAAITNPKNIVKGYFEAKINNDWGRMFDYLSLEPSEFVNRDSFIIFMENRDTLDIVNFEISDISLDSDLLKTYSVHYLLRGNSYTETEIITLVKTSNNRLLFFNNYEIVVDNLTISNYRVHVPKGAEAQINDIKLKHSTNVNQNYDTYVITEIFLGSHHLEVEHPEYETYTELIYLYERGSNEHFVINLTPKGSVAYSSETTASNLDAEETTASEPNTNDAQHVEAVEDDALIALDENGMFAAGDGSEESPFIIITEQQLSNIRHELGSHYKLGRNIELYNNAFEIIGFGKFSSDRWDSENGFQGVLDGDGYTISGIYISSQVQCTGLFAAIGSKGIIRNLNATGQVKTTSVDANNAIGLIAGYNYGIIENCSVIATVEGTGRYAMVGGVVGANDGLVAFCIAEGVVNGWGEYVKAGGVVGLNLHNGRINESKNRSKIFSEYSAGGIAGWNDGRLQGNEDFGEIVDSRSTTHPNDFILPYSSTRELTDSDLRSLTAHELRIARNEIYARYGRVFRDEMLQQHFDSKQWYSILPKLSLGVEPTLTDLELSNIRLIEAYE